MFAPLAHRLRAAVLAAAWLLGGAAWWFHAVNVAWHEGQEIRIAIRFLRGKALCGDRDDLRQHKISPEGFSPPEVIIN